MAMCFDRPVAAEVSIRAFALRDTENADGWGLAWYDDHSLAVVKEPLRWRQSRFADFLQTYEHLRSPLFIGHIRHATTGGSPTRADTHPFSRELFGRYYCFAHNGTVREAFDLLPLGRYHPIGLTDSEHVFCYLLDQIADRQDHLQREEDWRWLHSLYRRINEMGKFNCLMCDGRRLFCYRDIAWEKGLTMRSVPMKQEEARHLQDPAIKVDLESARENRGVIVATRPLSRAAWHPLRKGELIVLEDGEIRFSSARRGRREERGAAVARSG